jgi:hypothetical protein
MPPQLCAAVSVGVESGGGGGTGGVESGGTTLESGRVVESGGVTESGGVESLGNSDEATEVPSLQETAAIAPKNNPHPTQAALPRAESSRTTL